MQSWIRRNSLYIMHRVWYRDVLGRGPGILHFMYTKARKLCLEIRSGGHGHCKKLRVRLQRGLHGSGLRCVPIGDLQEHDWTRCLHILHASRHNQRNMGRDRYGGHVIRWVCVAVHEREV